MIDTFETVNAGFLSLFEQTDDALARGAADRRRIIAAIARGEEPQGPRVEWLKETGMKFIDVLGQAAQQYNDATPGDRISVQDMLDALDYAARLIRSNTK